MTRTWIPNVNSIEMRSMKLPLSGQFLFTNLLVLQHFQVPASRPLRDVPSFVLWVICIFALQSPGHLLLEEEKGENTRYCGC